jgi:hypothetical protein
LRRALKYLADKSMLPPEAQGWYREAEWPELQEAARWQAAVASLESDADAALPQ